MIGTVEVITFRTTRMDHPYWFSISGLINGTSVGHVALRFRIQDATAIQEFSAQFNNIPNRATKNAHELYFSFWPRDANSILKDHRHDCEQSANYSPFLYSHRFTKYLQPPVKIVKSYLPVLDKFNINLITLPPAIILHTTRLQNAYGTKIAIIAQIYANLYSTLRRMLIHEQNAEMIFANDPEKIQAFQQLTNIASSRVEIFENYLQQNVPDLENFITYGLTERDAVTLPLTRKHFLHMLIFMRHVADNPHLYQYNVFSTNCADISLRTLLHGFGEQLQHLHMLRSNGITLTPTFLLQTVATLQLAAV